MLARRFSFLALLLLLPLFSWAQSVIRVNDPQTGKTHIIRSGDWLRAYAYPDSSWHEGRITYIGEKGIQLEGRTYALNELDLVCYNSRRREIATDVADFVGHGCMIVGGAVFRVGVELCAAGDEKFAAVVGLPTLGVGGAIWLTGAIAHGVVYPILAATNERKISNQYTAELTDDIRRRRPARKYADDVYEQD